MVEPTGGRALWPWGASAWGAVWRCPLQSPRPKYMQQSTLINQVFLCLRAHCRWKENPGHFAPSFLFNPAPHTRGSREGGLSTKEPLPAKVSQARGHGRGQPACLTHCWVWAQLPAPTVTTGLAVLLREAGGPHSQDSTVTPLTQTSRDLTVEGPACLGPSWAGKHSLIPRTHGREATDKCSTPFTGSPAALRGTELPLTGPRAPWRQAGRWWRGVRGRCSCGLAVV